MRSANWMSAASAVLFATCLSQAQPPAASPSVPWQTATSLNDVDLSGLSASQKAAALKLMRETGCTCGCGMKVAQCRVEDPPCTYSRGLAGMMAKGIRDGKSAAEVGKLVASSALGRPREPQKVLEDPIQIPTAGAPSTGPADARVQIVEFSDFECPYCAKAAGQIASILKAYPNDVRLVYKQFPLSMHPHAKLAALASLAAQEQGKFWEMHDTMFGNFRHINRESLLAWAQQSGLDMDKFKAALDSPQNQARVRQDTQDGEYAGVSGTPSIFINGKHYNGPVELAVLKPILDAELKSSARAAR